MTAELLDDLRTTTRDALETGTGDVVDELDLAGMLVDDDRGGLGMGDPEMVLVSSELGRALAPSGFLPTVVLAATLCAEAGTDEAVERLAGLAAGQIGYAVAIATPAWTARSSDIAATIGPDGDWRLNGRTWGFAGPAADDAVLAVATTEGGIALFGADAGRVEKRLADELDSARGLIEVVFADTKAELIAGNSATNHAVQAAYRRALLAVAAEQTGVARVCLDMAVDYAKTRSQFGSPIGSFQAIKHRCAEVLLDVELADAVVETAIRSASMVDAELAFVVSSRAAVAAAEANIHIHGGIGFTWEHPAHRYLRRARVNAAALGSPAAHRAAIAGSAGLVANEET